MSEVWSKWQPLPNIKKYYYIVSVTDNAQGFEVLLRTSNDSDKVIRVLFKDSIVAYRRTDESFVSGIVGPVADTYGKEFASGIFFKIENSEYLKWFVKISVGMVEIRRVPFTHFSIFALDSILDIIAVSEPVVEFID